MASSGAVYQPTTVTYESGNGVSGQGDDNVNSGHNHHQQSGRWSDHPISYLAASVSQAARRPCGFGFDCIPSRNVIPIIYLTSSIACFAIGLTMLINGAIGYSKPPKEDDDEGFYLSVTIIGSFLFILSFLFISLYLKVTHRWCFRSRKDHLEGVGNCQALTVNPSTDLLVTAQYAPVSEVAYQPRCDDTVDTEHEHSKLMQSEKTDITSEDTDRMVESDPRIVLRPLNQHLTEET